MSLVDDLNAIRDERGTLTPETVVEAASAPEHPLHNRFDWDDTAAAHKWRLTQAGELLRVTFRPDQQRPDELRAFMAVRGEHSPRSEYVPTSEAMSDPFTRELLLRQMKRDWLTFKARYERMDEFADLFREASAWS